MAVSMACSGGRGSPGSLHPPPHPPGATEIRVSGCSPEQLRWRPRSEQGGKVGAQYFQPRESRIPLGYLQPQHSSARGWGGGAGLTTFPTRPPPEVRFTLARRPRQPESQRWKGYCPRGGWGGLCRPSQVLVGCSIGRSHCTGSCRWKPGSSGLREPWAVTPAKVTLLTGRGGRGYGGRPSTSLSSAPPAGAPGLTYPL